MGTIFQYRTSREIDILIFSIFLSCSSFACKIASSLVMKDTDMETVWSYRKHVTMVTFFTLCVLTTFLFCLVEKEKSIARGPFIEVIRVGRGYVDKPNRPPTHLSSVELTESKLQSYPLPVTLEKQGSNYSLSGQGNPVSVSSDHFEEHPVASDIEHCNCRNSGFKMYEMNSRPRGYIRIISNEFFNREEIRHGTVNDCNRLEDLFEKYLDFVVDVQHNKTAKEMEELIKNLSSLELLHNMDSLVVVLLSHGFGDSILGTDGNTKNILDLVKLLNGDNCPAMKGKPKMFIVNACRGNVDFGHRSPLDGIVSDANVVKSLFLDQLPSDSDFVIAYSTFPGALSFRDTEKGSYFIQCLVDVFSQSAHKEHV